jgi:hypothetical protein
MSDFAKMDAFFFITTIVVIVIGVILAFILLRVWRILGHVEEISKDVSAESALLRGDIAELRGKMQSGLNIIALGSFFQTAFKRFTGRTGKRKSSREEDA